MWAGAEGFEFSDGRVGAWDNGLADIDPAGLVFAEPIQGDRLAVALWGWAEESWLIDYSEIIGDPLVVS